MLESDDMIIARDSEILNGVPVFAGTRVPVSALLENIEAGVSIDEFLENFPTVSREQVMQILETEEFHADLAVANKVMRDDRDVLRKLAQ